MPSVGGSVHPGGPYPFLFIAPADVGRSWSRGRDSSLRGRLHGANWNRNRIGDFAASRKDEGRRRDGSVPRSARKSHEHPEAFRQSPGQDTNGSRPRKDHRGSERQWQWNYRRLTKTEWRISLQTWSGYPQHERASKAHRRQWRTTTSWSGGAYGDYFALDADGESSAMP